MSDGIQISDSEATRSTVALDLEIPTGFQNTSQVQLNGDFTPESLVEKLAERWVRYWECHECGRSDYCKFAKPHPHHKHKMAEIRCGVAVTVIREFIERNFERLRELQDTEQREIIWALYHLTQFVYKTETRTGNLISPPFLGNRPIPHLDGS